MEEIPPAIVSFFKGTRGMNKTGGYYRLVPGIVGIPKYTRGYNFYMLIRVGLLKVFFFLCSFSCRVHLG